MRFCKRPLSFRFYVVIILLPFIILTFVLLGFLHLKFVDIKNKSENITENLVPKIIATQQLLRKADELHSALDITAYAYELDKVEEVALANYLLPSDPLLFNPKLEEFQKALVNLYKVRVNLNNLRKRLDEKLQEINEIASELNLHSNLWLEPSFLFDAKADQKFVQRLNESYLNLSVFCRQKRNDGFLNLKSKCLNLDNLYKQLQDNFNQAFHNAQAFNSQYYKIKADFGSFINSVTEDKTPNLLKEMVTVEHVAYSTRNLVLIVIVVISVAVVAEILLLYFLLINPIFRLSQVIRSFKVNQKVSKKIPSSCIQEIQDIYTLLNPLLKDVSDLYSESSVLHKQNADLQYQALFDDLTGLLNRRALNLLIRDMPYAKLHMAVCMVDIDFFKLLNDAKGHCEGDNVLQVIAKTLREKIEKHDLIYRFGGEEFCIVLFDIEKGDELKIAKRLCAEIENLKILNVGTDSNVTISAGTSLVIDKEQEYSVVDLIHQSDAALYRAKNTGRNKAVSYEEVLRL